MFVQKIPFARVIITQHRNALSNLRLDSRCARHGNYKYLCSELYKASSEFELSQSDIKMVVRFSKEQIERFSDRPQNWLENVDCRSIFMEFLCSPGKDNLMRAFKLWTLANENLTLTDEMQTLMNQVDRFQRGHLDEMDPHDQIEYVKSECCRRFAGCLNEFITYLRDNHQT